MTGFVLGNLANGFIVLVNCIDWVKRQKFSWTDGILTGLAVSRIGLLWVILFYSYASVYNSVLLILGIRTIVNIMWIVSNHFNNWLVTMLSILYLLKIANFSSHIFLYLKWRVKSVLLTIMLGSLLFLVTHFAMESVCENMLTNTSEGNMTWKIKFRAVICLSSTTVFTLVIAIPFTMSLISFLLLIFSLWRHLKRMQLRGEGSQDLSTKIHLRALQTIISFLLMFALFFMALIISVWSPSHVQSKPIHLLCLAAGTLNLLIHSLILIWGNQKPKQACVSFLRQLRCWLKKRK
ncbi:PREDICTED: taste receptor type 2 member 31-like [Condylura cristata]|uniref:taste receptor type 2 member 31-like n=1 Tax=Condylura cristata TaxID=143302 RepID=UPI00064345A8|nr:PREDICTED: taste receptor type 2 member 31-like [Condylura cristata]